jgi:CubicO group peptidase (beta-lactamase class C family)
MPPLARRIGIIAAVTIAVLVVAAFAVALVASRGPLGGLLNLFADGRRAEGFRTLHEALPSNAVAASGDVWAFERAERPLPERYTFGDAERATAEFLRATETTGLLVVRDGVILHEAYFQGYDERSLATSFSVAKSFVSALVGIALERGHLRSLDDPIDAYVPELAGSAFAGVPIRDVLTMSSGVAFVEDYTSMGSDVMVLPLRLFGLRRSVAEVLRGLPRERAPGSVHDYSSGDALALGLLLTGATGRSVAAFLEEVLWGPAGMEAGAAWSTDLAGQELTYAFLAATLRDYARFGRLYLDGGRRDGVQVVPAAWVEASLRPAAAHLQPGASPPSASGFGAGFGYGYQWWLPDGDEGDFLAMGIWGQFVYVHPERRIVIVKTSTDPGHAVRERETLAVFRTIARAMGEGGSSGY